MTFTRHISRLLSAVGRKLRARPACSLTGVEPEWLAHCASRPGAVRRSIDDSCDDDIALRLARAL